MPANIRSGSCTAALLLLAGCAATMFAAATTSTAPDNAQITVLYDAFGKAPTMQKDWGYAALVEYGENGFCSTLATTLRSSNRT